MIGKIVSHYKITRELGSGGMGVVYRAQDQTLGQTVALKFLPPRLAQDPRRVKRFLGEVRNAREIAHPNVCRVYDVEEAEGRLFLSMEYIDGITLLKLLENRGPLSLREAGEIAAQFLSGLDAVHRAGLVHRDFKPENVMLTRAGRVVVMDFGLAKGLGEERTGSISGTPAYMAPEQATSEQVDHRMDVYTGEPAGRHVLGNTPTYRFPLFPG